MFRASVPRRSSPAIPVYVRSRSRGAKAEKVRESKVRALKGTQRDNALRARLYLRVLNGRFFLAAAATQLPRIGNCIFRTNTVLGQITLISLRGSAERFSDCFESARLAIIANRHAILTGFESTDNAIKRTEHHGSTVLPALEQPPYQPNGRAFEPVAETSPLRRDPGLRRRDAARPPDNLVRVQPLLRDAAREERSPTSHHLPERCQLRRDESPARLHVQRRSERVPEPAAHVPQDSGGPADPRAHRQQHPEQQERQRGGDGIAAHEAGSASGPGEPPAREAETQIF